MNYESASKKVKRINVNLDKCIGCRACEVACSTFHARPKYSSINPSRSRIRVVVDMMNDEYVPVRAAEYSKSECDGRNVYRINGKEYSECSFCGAVCPSRDLFKEPDSGLPLRCDMCEDDPPQIEPLCVQVCRVGALTYEEFEEEVREETNPRTLEVGLKSLIDRHGLEKLANSMIKMAKNG